MRAIVHSGLLGTHGMCAVSARLQMRTLRCESDLERPPDGGVSGEQVDGLFDA